MALIKYYYQSSQAIGQASQSHGMSKVCIQVINYSHFSVNLVILQLTTYLTSQHLISYTLLCTVVYRSYCTTVRGCIKCAAQCLSSNQTMKPSCMHVTANYSSYILYLVSSRGQLNYSCSISQMNYTLLKLSCIHSVVMQINALYV